MDDRILKNEIMKEIKRRGLLEQEEQDEREDDSDVEETEEGLYKLPSKTIKILTDRIKDEYTAHYFYRAATNWCRDKNYKKAAEFFSNEADDELTHAKKIQEYMVDFNIIPQIPQAPIDHKFDNLTTDLDEFNATDKVIALQIVSGREGISLKNVEYLVFYNIQHSAVSYWQARDRLTTINRLNNKVYWIFSENGIEEKIYKIVKSKMKYTINIFKKDYCIKS